MVPNPNGISPNGINSNGINPNGINSTGLNSNNLNTPFHQQFNPYAMAQTNFGNLAYPGAPSVFNNFQHSLVNPQHHSVNNGLPGYNIEYTRKSNNRRERTSYSKMALDRLEASFVRSMYPDVHQRESLASFLNLAEGRIQVWFKNRRAKYRQQVKQNQIIEQASKSSRREIGNESPIAGVPRLSPRTMDGIKTESNSNSRSSSSPHLDFKEIKLENSPDSSSDTSSNSSMDKTIHSTHDLSKNVGLHHNLLKLDDSNGKVNKLSPSADSGISNSPLGNTYPIIPNYFQENMSSNFLNSCVLASNPSAPYYYPYSGFPYYNGGVQFDPAAANNYFSGPNS
uniref:Homeobox domain-containing protein n=1 Tax=Rhabditophanes sp. KR3021 TaxID=114890 RepID=A0AC35UC94_9BILA